MIQIKNILTGFWNWLNPNKEIEEMARRRKRHCYGFKFKENNFTTVTTPRCGRNKGGICELCGCVLKAKIRVPEEYCPSAKWGPEEVKV